MENKYYIGVDIGGTAVKIGKFDINITLLEKWSIPTDISNEGKNILPDIAKSLEKHALTSKNILGIGIGVPGSVCDEANVNKCVNLGWESFNVAETLRSLTGVANVKVANDANAAALGEYSLLADSGCRNMVFVTLGTGIGFGIIANGNLINGFFGAAGESGHMHVPVGQILHDLNTDKIWRSDNPTDGKYFNDQSSVHSDELERFASANGVTRCAKAYLEQNSEPSTLRNEKELNSRVIYDAAKSGDALAIRITEREAELLGCALANVSCVIDPEAYIIGGGMSAAGEFLIDGIRRYFAKYAFHASKGTRIEAARLGNDAGIYGLAYLTKDQMA